MQKLSRIAAPAGPAVGLADIKAALRIDHGDEDQLVIELIEEAEDYITARTGRQLVTATYDERFDAFPGVGSLTLSRPPCQSITSITYLDPDGASQTLSADVYELVADEPARVRLSYGQAWPSTLAHPGSVVVRFVAGYGAAAEVNPRMRQAVKLYVAHRYENREPWVAAPGLTVTVEMPLSLTALCNQLAVRGIA